MKILAILRDDALRRLVHETAAVMVADVIAAGDPSSDEAARAAAAGVDVLLLDAALAAPAETLRRDARRAGAAVVVACRSLPACVRAAGVDEWVRYPLAPDELRARFEMAVQRARAQGFLPNAADAAERFRYEELLHDKQTGSPTLPLVVERVRDLLNLRGRLDVIYIDFLRSAAIEETYGWQRLDAVLATAAAAVRAFFERELGTGEGLLLLPYSADDAFVVLADVPEIARTAGLAASELSSRLEGAVREAIAAEHGTEIGSLGTMYIGSATVVRRPKVRTERLLYRGVRDAAQAARSAEEWERVGRVAELRRMLRDGAFTMEYHPIVNTRTEAVFGYEALARGLARGLRSPEILFEVAEEANLVWELGRLLRRRAVDGIFQDLEPHQLLFLNVDPHDFDDPGFRDLEPGTLGVDDASRVVLEITERVAITDYPRFQKYLAALRRKGFRFAVDDAGSGYAGLGSIANLEPDFIKLDISLISGIDTNFLKQNLVETLVRFAESHDVRVIAEGVERAEEFETVRRLGVHLSQGFLFLQPRYAA